LLLRPEARTEARRARRVLLVEDNQADASLVVRYLTRDDEDYDITVMTTAAEGLAHAREQAPDVVLVDYDLPDSNGLEFIDELGTLAWSDGAMPVILAFTGQTDPRIAAALISHGALDYMSKEDLTEESARLAVRQAVLTLEMREKLERRTRESDESRRSLVAAYERASFLANVSALLARALDPVSVHDTIALLAIPYLGDVCFVDTIGDDGTVTRRYAASARMQAILDVSAFERAPLLDGSEGAARAIRSGTAALYGASWLHALSRNDPGVAAMLRQGHAGSVVVAPLEFDDRALGALTFVSRGDQREDARETAEEFARRASTALVNARAFAAERAATRASEAARARLHVLARVSELLGRTLESDAAIATLTEVLIPAFCDHVTVVLKPADHDARVIVSASVEQGTQSAMDDAIRRFGVIEGRDVGLAATLRHGRSEFYPDAATLALRLRDPAMRAAAQALDFTSYLAVAITDASGRTQGAIVFGTQFGRRFTRDDVAIGEDIGRRLGMYLNNANLFAREREIARALQQSLLPPELPVVPGVDFAARYIAGAAGLDVGGDWYDVIPLAGGSVAFAIGDVAGRGVLAAATMGQMRSSLRAYLLEGLEPSDALARLNGFVLSQERNTFATVGVGVLDIKTGLLRYASAGHLPPLALDASHAPQLMQVVGSLPVGVLADTVYEQTETPLAPGATLVMYTDGLIETRERGLDQGFAELLTASAGPDRDPETLVAAIVERMGVAQSDDDVTMLALRSTRSNEAAFSEARSDGLGVTYPALPPSAPLARKRLREYLQRHALSAERVNDVLLAVGEAVANAVEHAYGGAVQPGIFTMRASLTADALTIDVVDHGVWRQRRSEPPTVFDDRGRGFMMMETLADSVRVRHDLTGTRVSLVFALA
jgi:serine phosphatase RsbU (regulator of sigma subunit)/anti-sigma regulatory factor (Ser/Thr protein kinase)/DNA-binding NarL/FixJ family response regulator